MGMTEYALVYGIVLFAVMLVFLSSLSSKDRMGWRITAVLGFCAVMQLSYEFCMLFPTYEISKWMLSLCLASSGAMMLFYGGFTGAFLGGWYDRQCAKVRPFAVIYAVVDFVGILTNPIHGKLFNTMVITTPMGESVLTYTPKVGYIPHVLFMTIFLMLTLTSLLAEARRSPLFFGTQLMLVELVGLVAALSNSFYLLATPNTYDFAVPMAGISAIVFYSYVYVFAAPSQTLHIRRMIIENMGNGVVYFGKERLLEDYNQTASQLLSFSDDYIGVLDEEMFAEGRLGLQFSDLTSGENYEVIIPIGDKQTFYDVQYERVKNSETKEVGSMYIFHDITELRELNDEIEIKTKVDSISGFENKQIYDDLVVEMSHPKYYPLCMAVINVNGLALVNSLQGISEGDRMVGFVSEVLKSQVREGDRIVRMDGETVVFMPKTSDAQAVRIMKRVQHVISTSNEFSMRCSVEFGVAEKNNSEIDISDALNLARNSMKGKKILSYNSPRSTILDSLNRRFISIGYHKPGQGERIRTRCVEICRRLSMSDQMTTETMMLAELHDIGMLTVSDNILTKNGPLTEEEWDEIKQHPEKGYDIASAIPELASIAPYILAFRERWDGTGYPYGMSGKEIPIQVRIVNIVTVYDILTQGSAYRPAMKSEDALVEISRSAGTQFDPYLAEKFVKMIEEEKGVYSAESYSDYYISDDSERTESKIFFADPYSFGQKKDSLDDVLMQDVSYSSDNLTEPEKKDSFQETVGLRSPMMQRVLQSISTSSLVDDNESYIKSDELPISKSPFWTLDDEDEVDQ